MSAAWRSSRARRVLAVALWLLVASASPALADHCGSLMDCALTSGGFLGAAAGLSVALLGLGIFNQLLAPRIAGTQGGRRAGSDAARAQQAQQAADEKAARDAANDGAPPPSPGAAKVGGEIRAVAAAAAGVNPTADSHDPSDLLRGRRNCVGVATALDDRFSGRAPDAIAPDFIDRETGHSAGLVDPPLADWVGNGNDWESMTPEEAVEALRGTPGQGILSIHWADGSSHVLNMVNVSGDVFFVDGQPSKPGVSSTLEGLYGEDASGIHDTQFLFTWPPK